jgi:hypothetical protein
MGLNLVWCILISTFTFICLYLRMYLRNFTVQFSCCPSLTKPVLLRFKGVFTCGGGCQVNTPLEYFECVTTATEPTMTLGAYPVYTHLPSRTQSGGLSNGRCWLGSLIPYIWQRELIQFSKHWMLVEYEMIDKATASPHHHPQIITLQHPFNPLESTCIVLYSNITNVF